VKDLTRLAPHVITLELSTYGLRYRLEEKRSLNTRFLLGLQEIQGTGILSIRELKKLLRSTGIGGIRALLDLPFEYKAARFYSQGKGIPLYCLDISSLSRRLLSDVDELLSPDNLQKVVAFEATPLQATVAMEYQHAEAFLLNGRQYPRFSPISETRVWEKRERILAKRIRKILAGYQGQTVVHICGWQHIVNRQGALFNLLADLKPKRVFMKRLYP
jgi:hypothetical protein